MARSMAGIAGSQAPDGSPGPTSPGRKLHVVVGTPCFGNLVDQFYMLSILALQRLAVSEGFGLDVVLLGGDALITRARSTIVSRFLDNPDATHLLFVDADISFAPRQFTRLLTFDKDFVAGLYPIKQIDWPAVPQRVVGGESLQAAGLSYVGNLCAEAGPAHPDGFATAQFAGTGFQLIKRVVFERLMAAHPELKFNKLHALNGAPPGDNLYALFDCMIDPVTKAYLSEDYAFCHRWRALGGEIWLDLQSQITHAGTQYFRGDAALRFRPPVAAAAPGDAPAGPRDPS